MRIGELARRVGVAPRLLRYYEEQGLLRPRRTSSGYREYGEADVDVVHHVRTLLAAGLSTTTIGELLPCMGADGERLIASCPELLDDLQRERDRLDGHDRRAHRRPRRARRGHRHGGPGRGAGLVVMPRRASCVTHTASACSSSIPRTHTCLRP